ncbi:MAG TPA: hypothetical protein VEW93_06990 [Acidimicrobiales bacterium]|nr:hypothetical protein [Acidimicrobiales bacterium]
MSSLIPASGGIPNPLEGRSRRALGRQLDRLDVRRDLAQAQLEHQAQLQAAKTQALGYIGNQAMQTVTLVSQLEGQLGQLCPLAVSRLQGIADMTALSIADVVASSPKRLEGGRACSSS